MTDYSTSFTCAHCGGERRRGVTLHQTPGALTQFRINPACPHCHAPRFELLEGDDPEDELVQPRYGEDVRTQTGDGRDIFRREGATGRPAYTMDDPPGTVRVQDFKPGYDKVTFPIQKNNAISRMSTEQDLPNTEGSLWPLQQAIADAKFDLLKRVVAEGAHMVGPITATVVIEMECPVLTNKASMVTKVKSGVETIDLLLPNGNLRSML